MSFSMNLHTDSLASVGHPQQDPPEMGGILGTENQVLTLEMFSFPELHPHVEGVLEIEWKSSRDTPPNSPDPHQEGRAALGHMIPPRGRSPCATLRGLLPTRRETDPGRAAGSDLVVRGDESAPDPQGPPCADMVAEARLIVGC